MNCPVCHEPMPEDLVICDLCFERASLMRHRRKHGSEMASWLWRAPAVRYPVITYYKVCTCGTTMICPIHGPDVR